MSFLNIVKTIQKLNKYGSIIIKNKELLTNHANNVKMINSMEHKGEVYVNDQMKNNKNILSEEKISKIYDCQTDNISEFENAMRELKQQWSENKTSINKYWVGY
tara:strand:+ start:5284 stop:5595 length:312 start_codon:yes stop_codon:yes gene_type:complete